jgi:hypothetical protein
MVLSTFPVHIRHKRIRRKWKHQKEYGSCCLAV